MPQGIQQRTGGILRQYCFTFFSEITEKEFPDALQYAVNCRFYNLDKVASGNFNIGFNFSVVFNIYNFTMSKSIITLIQLLLTIAINGEYHATF